ncbi:MAG: hypothetical protein Q8L10_01710 [Candidatus Moranbacteria bacterium]|nr:hypothetical protein [Candidatus Moranbacteria bacterium]
MKIKYIHLTLIVLFALTITSFAFFVSAQEQARTTNNIFLDSDQDGLSDAEEKSYGTDPQTADTDGDSYTDGAEVKSGYDPLIKSPGDKLIPDATTLASAADSDPSQPNLTKEVAHKISAVLDESNQNNEEISLDQIKNIVADSLDPQITADNLPKISTENIQIKKQSYSSLSKEKAEEKRKEDFTNYIVGLSYILSSNSPEPITSTTDINSLTDSISSRLIGAITSGDISSLQDLATDGEKIMQQVQDIEVPEELVDIHVKGLQLIQYAINLQDSITPNSDDPILDITNYSKMQNLVELMISYSSDVQEKFSKYGLEYDETMQAKLADYGIEINPDLLENLTQE